MKTNHTSHLPSLAALVVTIFSFGALADSTVVVPSGRTLVVPGDGLDAACKVVLEPGASIRFRATAELKAPVHPVGDFTIEADAGVTGTLSGMLTGPDDSVPYVGCVTAGAGGKVVFAGGIVLGARQGTAQELTVVGDVDFAGMARKYAIDCALGVRSGTLCICEGATLKRERTFSQRFSIGGAGQPGDACCRILTGGTLTIGNNTQLYVGSPQVASYESSLALDGGMLDITSEDRFFLNGHPSKPAVLRLKAGRFRTRRRLEAAANASGRVIWEGGVFLPVWSEYLKDYPELVRGRGKVTIEMVGLDCELDFSAWAGHALDMTRYAVGGRGCVLKAVDNSGAHTRLRLDGARVNGLALDLHGPDVELVDAPDPFDLGWVLPGNGRVTAVSSDGNEGRKPPALRVSYVVPPAVVCSACGLRDTGWHEGFSSFSLNNLTFQAGSGFRPTGTEPIVLAGSLTLPAAMTCFADADLDPSAVRPLAFFRPAGGVVGAQCEWTCRSDLPVRNASPARKPDIWLLMRKSFSSDERFADVSNVIVRAAKAGYTGIVMDNHVFTTPQYLSEVDRMRLFALKRLMDANGLELIPTGWGGCRCYPRLIETIGIRDAPYVAQKDRIVADTSAYEFPNGGLEDFDLAKNTFAGWKVDLPGVQAFVDTNVFRSGRASLRMEPGKEPGGHARLSRRVDLSVGRRYRLTARFRGKDLVPAYGVLRMCVTSASGKSLAAREIYNLDEKEGWRTVSFAFQADHTNAYVYCGCWRGKSGAFWVDDVALEETGPCSLSARLDDPLSLRNATTGRVYEQGRDFMRIAQPSAASIAFARPKGSAIADGERLLLDAYVIAHAGPKDDTATCMSDPFFYDNLREAARWTHENFRPKHWMLGIDELRTGGTCPLCLSRKTDMAHILGDATRRMHDILTCLDPEIEVSSWSDMFDPNHNARKTYYGCKGSFVGVWDHIPKDLTMMLWYGGQLTNSVPFFAGRGFPLRGSICIDSDLSKVDKWKRELGTNPNFRGYMYTTWSDDYTKLEEFAEAIRRPLAP